MLFQRIFKYLKDLLDVGITSPTNGQVLAYNASAGKWVNQAVPSQDLSGYLQKSGGVLTGTISLSGNPGNPSTLGPSLINSATHGVGLNLFAGGSTGSFPGGDVTISGGSSVSGAPGQVKTGGGTLLDDGIGNMFVNGSLTLTSDQTAYDGSQNFIKLNNTDEGGQNVIAGYVNGNEVARWRTDYAGNISWVAGSAAAPYGVHDFYVGGDYGVGVNVLHIGTNIITGGGNTLDDGGGGMTVYDVLEVASINANSNQALYISGDCYANSFTAFTGGFAGDGSSLINLQSSHLAGALPAISGASLTSLNGSSISTGTVSDSRLTTNVPLKNAANTFTAPQTFSSIALTTGGTVIPSTAYYGTIYAATSWANTSNFTANNGATISASGGALIVGGGITNRSVTIDINTASQTALSKWQFSTTLVVGTVNATSYGCGIGIHSTNHYNPFHVMGRIDLSSVASGGTLYIDVGTSSGGALNQDTATSSSLLAFSSGHTINLTFERNEDTFTFTAHNITAQTLPVSVSYQVSVAYNMAFFLPNTGRFAIYEIAGSQTFTAISITSNAIKNADICLVGDSKIAGFNSGLYATMFATQLQNNFRAITLAGGNDGTQEVLSRVGEIIALNPKSVILNIGRNDLAGFSGSPAYSPVTTAGTVQYNYNSIVTQLQAAGITVYHLLPLYETVVNQSAFSTWIQTTYGSANCIDAQGASYASSASNVLCPDNAHPNAFFHGIIYQAILHFYSINNPTFVSYCAKAIENAPIASTGNVTGFVDSGSTVLHLASTYTGNTGSTAYTISDVVYALKKLGLLVS